MPKDKAAANTFIDHLETIVLEHLTQEDFDVETFAGIAGCSRSDLYRKIKKATGKSVTQFIRDIRLRKSLELLRQGGITASEVSHQVGFNSPTYFSKCFKEKYGFTPGETPLHSNIEQSLREGLASRKQGHWFGMQLVYFPIILTALIITGGTLIWMMLGVETSEKLRDKTPPPISPDQKSETVFVLPENSIAILPLANWTGDTSKDYIGSGVAHDIISALSEMNTIGRVAPMSSVISYKDSLPNMQNISNDLQVKYVLFGGVQQTGDLYKFSIEIINAPEDSLYWSEVYIVNWEDTGDTFRMESEIAEQVSKILGTPNLKHLNLNAPTLSSKARNYYLQGIHMQDVLTRNAWESSIALFNKALEEDPQYIDAYLALATTWGYGGMNWGYASQEEAWTNMRLNLNKIIEINPGHKTAPYFLQDGYFYYELSVDPEVPGIEPISLDKMLKFNADFAGKLGEHQEAIEGNLKWLQNEPYSGTIYALLAINHYFLGEKHKARNLLAENYKIYRTDLDFLRESAKAWYFLEDHKNMEKAVLFFFENFDERPSILRWLRAIVADHNGNTDISTRQLNILREKYQKRASGSPAWFIALYHAYKGEKEKTLEWLEKSYAAGETEMTWLAQEPDLKILGDHPGYIALLDSMNFPQSARTHVINAGNSGLSENRQAGN